jgi:hypothetical protein
MAISLTSSDGLNSSDEAEEDMVAAMVLVATDEPNIRMQH